MPHKKTMPVTPQGGYIDYQDDRLGRPMDTLDMDPILDPAQSSPTFEERFQANACMMDGCNGQEMIDTLFENTVELCIENPRSDMGERPYKPGAIGDGFQHYNPRYGANKPMHEGVDNPAPVDEKKGLYPHRRY